MSELQNQVAIITGATSGIGRSVARELGGAGMRLVLTGRREERLRELATDLDACETIAGDITEPSFPGRLLNAAIDRFGRCDAVFNNAGVMHTASIEETDIEVMARMVRINVEAMVRVAYTALKHFRTQGSGHLVNVSSILGTKVRPTAGVYAATKYAVEALSEALRMEVAKSAVKVSTIEPGLVATELQDHFEVHPAKAFGIEQPLKPEDIARCVRFMLEQPAHVRIPVMMVLPGEQPL